MQKGTSHGAEGNVTWCRGKRRAVQRGTSHGASLRLGDSGKGARLCALSDSCVSSESSDPGRG